MGQRHQVYLKLPAGKGKAAKVIGLHHQWLYGQTAIRMLRNCLKFCSQTEEYSPFGKSTYESSRAQDLLNALYSTDYQTGYYHSVSTLDAECDDPRRGDNNDGITIIDLAGDKPRYCFMSIGHLEGKGKQPKTFRPLTATEYLEHYYPDYQTPQIDPKNQEFHNETVAILAELAAFEVLSLADVKAIFPAMFESKAKRKPAAKAALKLAKV